MDSEPRDQQVKTRRRVARRAAPLATVAVIAGVVGGGIGSLARGDATPAAAAPVVATAKPTTVTKSSITAVYEQASAGVVEITVTGSSSGRGGFGPFGQSQQTESEGSGFVLDKSGHIVTNEHVVEGAD